jgi:hypothetical protein
MKKIGLISVAAVVAVAGVWFWVATRFNTSWQTINDHLPTAVEAAGWEIIEERTVDSCAFPLSVASGIRQILHPQQRVQPVLGFPNSTTSYLLEWEQNHARVQCLVRYSEEMALQIGVRYPSAARQEANNLRRVLWKTFPRGYISTEEIAETRFNIENR